MIIDPAARGEQTAEVEQAIAQLVQRVRLVGGVLVQVLDAGEEAAEVSAVGAGEDDLIVDSDVPDAFEGVDDLADGLHDMAIDRVIITGFDGEAAQATALGALASDLEVVVAPDAIAGDTDGLAEALEPFGGIARASAEIWLRM